MKKLYFSKRKIYQLIPNIITTTRLFLTILMIIFWIIWLENKTLTWTYEWKIDFLNEILIKIDLYFLLGSVVFLVASFTDFLDGYLARKWNVVSNFGKIVDPIVDKILITSALIFLVVANFVPLWLFLLFIIRELIVDGIRMFAASKKLIMDAKWSGKVKMIFQIIGITIIIFVLPINVIMYENNDLWFFYFVQNLFLLFACFFSYYSLIIYFQIFYRFIKAKKDN